MSAGIPTTPVVVPVNDCDANRHAEGNALLVRGAYAEAMATFRYIVEDCRPTTNAMPRVKLVAAACRIKNTAVAVAHFDKLPPLAKVVVGRICRDHNVSLNR